MPLPAPHPVPNSAATAPPSRPGLPTARPLRVTYLTSGAAGMICGSCFQDNMLARALTRHGVDIQLVPTYTPIRTDEPNASTPQVFFGGLNIYLAQKIPGYARLPGWLTRWLDHPGLLRWATSFGLETDARDLGALTVSVLRGRHGRQRREIERLVEWLQTQPRPDVIHFSNLLIGGCIPQLRERLGSLIVVTLQGDDIFLDSLPAPYQQQAIDEMRRLVPSVDRFLVHSDYYGRHMASLLEIPPQQLVQVPLAIDPADLYRSAAERATDSGPTRTIGYLARLAPEKGLHVLIDAFRELKRRPATESFRLRVAGWLGAHRRAYAEEQFRKLRDAGLADHFEHVGELDRGAKARFLQEIDLLCVPTTYHEPKGLFALEALAAGTPVVLPAHGAFPELMARLGGGVLTAPDDPVALAETLERLLRDDDHRRTLAIAGQQAVLEQAGPTAIANATLDLYGQCLAARQNLAVSARQ